MALQTVQPVWFDINPESAMFDEPIYTLDLPRRWHDAIKRLAGKSRNPPTRSLANTIQLFMPEVIRVRKWQRDCEWMNPWLLAWKELDRERVVTVFEAWLLESFPDRPQAARLANGLDPDELRWSEVNWGSDALDRWPNGTSNPGGLFFDALPDLMCEAISDEVKLGGVPLHLLKVRDGTASSLVEWPPRIRPGIDEKRAYRWSFCIIPSIQTIPWRPTPVALLNVSVRRWVSETGATGLWTPDRNKGVYLKMKDRWFSEGSERERLVRVNVAYGKGGETWEAPFDRIMKRLSLYLELPQPSELIKFPERYFEADGFSMGMVMSTRMRRHHSVKSGVPQRDWQDVLNSSRPALARLGLTLGPEVERVNLRSKQNTDLRSVGKEKNSSRRGRYGAETLKEANPDGARFLILHQTEAARAALEERIAKEAKRANGMEFTVVCERLGDEGAPLEDDSARKRCERVRAIQSRFANGENYSAALVEIPGEEYFKTPETRDLGDPKDTIRLGLAKAGIRSQFITMFDGGENDENREHRVGNAVLDALRQIGYLPGRAFDDFSKAFQERGNVQPDAELIGLWIKKRPDKREYLPVFVRISQRNIWDARVTDVEATEGHEQGFFDLSRIPVSEITFPTGRRSVFGWRPYPEGLIALGKNQYNWLNQWDAQRFITSALSEIDGNALLTVNSRNARAVWKWLQDKNVVMDSPPDIDAPGLRIARLRGAQGDTHESPSWIAPKGGGDLSNPSGLFATEDKRVSFSLHGTSPAMMKMADPKSSKVDFPGSAFARPLLKEIALLSLCDGDGPREWAWLTHTLRLMSPTYDYAVTVPYPMHLARKAVDDYVL